MTSKLRVLAVLAGFLGACGSDGEGSPAEVLPMAVLSAFPAELSALLERATVQETVTVDGTALRVGKLGNTPVVLGMTGIGLVNAARRTRALLDRFDVSGVIVSGVAGSSLRIADVAVPSTWQLEGGPSYAAHAPWLALASVVAASGATALEQCTFLPAEPSRRVCMAHQPAIVVGGAGQSDDPFQGRPFDCQVGGDDIYGCDVPGAAAAGAVGRHSSPRRAALSVAAATVVDMETAAIAQEAAARGLPFIAFRAVSDGAGDPLDLQVPFFQFAAYYRLAAHNAAAVTIAFLERLASSGDPGGRPQ